MDSTTPFQPWAANDGAKKDKELVDDAKHQRENVNPKHLQTASYDKESGVVQSVVPGPSSASSSGGEAAGGYQGNMDASRIASMQQIVENTISPEARQRVSQLIEAVEALSGAERLLLYLRLPTGVATHDPLKQPVNPLGSRAELQQTVTWIQTHLEVDPDVSLPKQDVYDEYIAHCMSNNMKPLSTADFGKVMKQVYPTVRPRRLGTRGNSRYCYAGLRKKIKLEVPQLPDLGETSKETTLASRETERIICDWAETKLGVKIGSLSELSRHLAAPGPPAARAATPPPPPPPLPALTPYGTVDDTASRQLMKHLKRKIQGHGAPGRPKKYKAPEPGGDSPSTSYAGAAAAAGAGGAGGGVKGEPEYEYSEYYYAVPPRAHPPPPPPPDHYRDPYAFEPGGADAPAAPYPRDLTLPPHPHPHPHPHQPINLSSDASLDLSAGEWRRRAQPPPPPRPLPGKKLILEAYQSETQAGAGAGPSRAPPPPPPQEHYLPKKMRAAEILGGKLAARHAPPPPPPLDAPRRPDQAFFEDPKNVTGRSKSTAAALARERQEAAAAAAPDRARRRRSPDPCCGLDGDICRERHAEILNRERVISICNIDKHDLDDYLNEGSSQEHEEELLHYFHRERAPAEAARATTTDAPAFLEAGLDPHDEHSQGKNEKICQLRELLAKNLKNQSGSSFQNGAAEPPAEPAPPGSYEHAAPPPATNGASLAGDATDKPDALVHHHGNGLPAPADKAASFLPGLQPQLFNGNGHHVPQSPTTRTQQYDFVPISDGCPSPRTFSSKSPLGFPAQRRSPSKGGAAPLGRSLQASPVSHALASPFVSPRDTPVPRSRACPRPTPQHTGRRRRDPERAKQFARPGDHKPFKSGAPALKYCQPMSAPPSPNIVSHYKAHMFPYAANGNGHFLPPQPQPLSADPLSSEVSQFFQESFAYRAEPEPAFRSQSAPLKPAPGALAALSYKTPAGSVPPTPVPNEFCDFGSLDACDISKACLNPETLDKIYDAIDSSTDLVPPPPPPPPLSNGCELLPEPPLLADELSSLLPAFPDPDPDPAPAAVDDFLKRSPIEWDLPPLLAERKYCASRSVPGTPLPLRRAPGPRRARAHDPPDYVSKSVPGTPQLAEGKVFSYSNRDFLINGNSVECARPLASPLHALDMHADLLADLDKIEPPYVDL